jgi:hypothetical protein
LRRAHFIVMLFCCILGAIGCPAQAEDQEGVPTERPAATLLEKPDRYFEMKVPEGFKLEPAEEPGIFKWKKDSAEIHVVVGDTFADSVDVLFQALRKGAEANKRMEEVRTLRIKGAQGLLYKEKTPEDSGRLRAWRLVVLTNKKMINVDFTAPAQDFNALAPGFESAVKSFKLKSSS